MTQSDVDNPVADITKGGSAGYSSSYECVLSQGKRLFVEKSTTITAFDPQVYDWTLAYYSFNGRRLNLEGLSSGTSTDNGFSAAARALP